jgi:hypothetical protein
MRQMRPWYPAALAVLATFTQPAALPAQAESGPRLRTDALEITLNGRVHMQFNTSSVDGVAPTEMLLRRVRLSAGVRINETISGRLQPEFAGSTISLADAFMQLTLSPGVQLLAGRAHRPFTIMEQTSTNQTIPIERGVRIRGLGEHDLSSLLNTLRYTDREVGFQVRGAPTDAPMRLNYAVAVLAGPLQGASGDQATAQYVARASVSPIERTRVALVVNRRDFSRTAGGVIDLEGGHAFGLDVEYGGPTPAPGAHLVAQAVTGDVDPFTDRGFSGGQVWASYRFAGEGKVTLIEPLLRLSHAAIDAPLGQPAPGGTLLTPGVNVYFGGLNRILVNYDVWLSAEGRNESSFKTQFQLAF